jgi:hypothetical protein
VKRRSEQGQAITEYVILLLTAFVLFSIVQRGLAPIFARWAQIQGKILETRFTKNLHRFR